VAFVDVAAGLSFTLPAHVRPRHLGLPAARAAPHSAASAARRATARRRSPRRGRAWSILRADVCAVCHDAPPRYPKVAAWRASKMARADATPGTRAEGCRDCHTTWGFLFRFRRAAASLAAARRRRCRWASPAPLATRRPPAALRQPPAPASLRRVATVRRAPSACRATRGRQPALWLGRGGQRADGTALEGPRAAREGGLHPAATTPRPTPSPARCTGCHETAHGARPVARRPRRRARRPPRVTAPRDAGATGPSPPTTSRWSPRTPPRGCTIPPTPASSSTRPSASHPARPEIGVYCLMMVPHSSSPLLGRRQDRTRSRRSGSGCCPRRRSRARGFRRSGWRGSRGWRDRRLVVRLVFVFIVVVASARTLLQLPCQQDGGPRSSAVGEDGATPASHAWDSHCDSSKLSVDVRSKRRSDSGSLESRPFNTRR
jgi:hypothetical protein